MIKSGLSAVYEGHGFCMQLSLLCLFFVQLCALISDEM